MDDDTFDPRNWLRPQNPPAKPGAADAAPAKTPEPTPPPPPASGDSALPEAWRGIGTGFTPGKPAAAPAAGPPASEPKSASPGRNILALALSLALVLVGAAAAWLTRVPSLPAAAPEAAVAVAVAPAPTPTTPAPGGEQRRIVLASSGDIDAALAAAGVAPAEAHAVAQEAARVLKDPGEINALIDLVPAPGGGVSLRRFTATYANGSGAVVSRDEAGHYAGSVFRAELTKQIKVLRGELDTNSFYSSAVAAGLVDTLIPEFINAFAFDFNIASEVNPGDTFEVAYEQSVDANGNPVGQPQLLFGSLTTKTKSLALYRFQPPGGEVGWYDGNGGSTKRGFMRTPVDGARITSNFGMRFHPVLHYTRLHAGVDFGVPVGTPVYAAAAGVVIGSHPTVCGGNMAVVQHDNGWVTRYFHLSRFAPGLYEGERVPQGFTLGLSGTTGTCTTGPHLHYELRINGEPVDPLSVPMDDKQKKKLEGPAMQVFLAQRNRVDEARAHQGG